MYRQKRKNFINRILFNQITMAIAGLLIIIAISYPLAKNVSKQYVVNKEIEELEKEISDLENKNLELSDVITYFESDQFTQEQARLNLNYKQKGEEVVVVKEKVEQKNFDQVIKDDGNKTIYNIRGLNNVKPKKEINNPVRWWRYFFE